MNKVPYIDPLENLEHFKIPQQEPRYLPIVSILVESRPELRERLLRIINWHRKWFRFHREIVVAFEDPQLPGVQYIHSKPVSEEWIRNWYSSVCIWGLNALCDAPYALVWQWDGFIVNPEQWTDEFLKWDYLGGPGITGNWKKLPRFLESKIAGWKSPFPPNVDAIVGNGGFSLRSKKFLTASTMLPQTGLSLSIEDLYLCIERRRELEGMGVRFAPVDLCYRFAKEGPYTYADDECFGFHSFAHFERVKRILESKYLPD